MRCHCENFDNFYKSWQNFVCNPIFKKVYPGNWGILWGCRINFYIPNMYKDSANYSKKISFVPPFLKKCTRECWLFNEIKAKIFAYSEGTNEVQTIWVKIMVNT